MLHCNGNNQDGVVMSDPVLDNVPLSSDSTILIVGAYQGSTIKYLVERCDPTIYAFEPQGWALEAAKSKVSSEKVHWYNYALGLQNGKVEAHSFGNDACSFTELANAVRS